jgi:serine phosphatase RsbU (regulator of sigma subunit)
MIDPVRFKRLLVLLIKVLIVAELVSALSEGMGGGSWNRFGIDLIAAGVLYLAWGRITALVREQKDSARAKMEGSPHSVTLLDAFVFSLLWSDEIYTDIPADRRRLVVIAYTLIALGLVVAFLKIGPGLMPLVVTSALVLGAVNLLSWVVSAERVERDALQTELRIAHDVQLSLMPRANPVVPGLDIAGVSLPAREVGGDLFEYASLDGRVDRLIVSVADVSGKGMHAAMAAVFTSGAFAGEVRRGGSPAEILQRMNSAVWGHARRGQFVAFLLASFDPHDRTLTFANAGQTRPLLRSGDSLQWLDAPGVHFPLGLQEESLYQERTLELKRGDLVLLVTDGVTEAMNARRDLYGSERLEALLRDLSAEISASAAIEAVRASVDAHAGTAPQHDDMTLVAIRVAGEGA